MDNIIGRTGTWRLPLALIAAATLLAAGALFSANAIGPAPAPEAGWTFSGTVYDGLPPDTSTPLPNVTVTLYGSDSAGVWGTPLASTTTNTAGAFALNTTQSFPFYHLVETDPPGFYSTGSQAGPGGAAVNLNWIRFQPTAAVTVAGNNFWDRRPVTPTPTQTPPTPTATPTYKPYPTYTPTPTTTGTVPNQADVRVSKRIASPYSTTFPPGTVVEYEIVVTNAGPAAAADVVATDTLPPGFTFLSASSGCSRITAAPPNDVVRCSLGTLAAGQTTILTISATVQQSACGRAKNRVEVSATTPDITPYNNQAYVSSIIAPCAVPGLLVNKRQLEPPGYVVHQGETVTYAIDITNIGNTPLNHVSLSDMLESQAFTYVDALPLPGRIATLAYGFEVSWRNLTEPAPTGFGRSLPPGGSFTVIVRALAASTGYAYNCANGIASTGDITVTDSSCTSSSIVSEQGLFLRKSLEAPAGGVGVVGQSLTFMVSLNNTGSTPITGIRLRDEYNTNHLTYVGAAYTPDSTANDGVLDWANLTQPQPRGFGQPLSPGNTRGFSVSFSAKAITPPGQTTDNCVQAWYWHEDQVEHETGRVCAPVRVVARSEPQIEVAKIVLEPSGDVVVPGSRVKFAFRVTNTGPTTIKNLKVTDTYNKTCLSFLPSGDASLDPGNTADDGVLDWASWQGVLALAPGAWLQIAPSVQFQAKAGSGCAETANSLQMTATDTGGKQATATASAVIHIRDEPQSLADAGDAPTKFNHAALEMSAYTGVVAQFPTVYDPAAGSTGPLHRNPATGSWLGAWVSREADADQAPDDDGVTNIAPGANAADRDREDDGLVTLSTLYHCQPVSLTFQVSVPSGAPTNTSYYLNAWLDWNRDGAWGGLQQCEQGIAGEWAVKDHVLPAGLAPGVHTLTAPAFMAWNPDALKPLWLRLTLSSVPSGRDDGSGPAGGYELGETEDYLIPGSVLPATATPTPTMTATATPTASATPTPTPTREACCLQLYMPLLLRPTKP